MAKGNGPKGNKSETVVMRQTKETPGTMVYTTEDHPGLRSLYIGKGTFKPMPKVIRLTVEVVEG